MTNALSWAKKGRGPEETITTSPKPPSAPIHRDMLLVHVSVARQMQNLLLLSLGVPDSISNHQTKASSAFSTCLTALLPHAPCSDLSRRIPRSKGSNSPAATVTVTDPCSAHAAPAPAGDSSSVLPHPARAGLQHKGCPAALVFLLCYSERSHKPQALSVQRAETMDGF